MWCEDISMVHIETAFGFYTMFSIIQYDMKWVFATKSSVRQNMENFEVLNFAEVKHWPLMQIEKHVKWSTFSLNIQISPTI